MGKPLYSDKEILAGRLMDDTKAIQNYNAKILEKFKNLYARRLLTIYDYNYLVNLLNVMDLKAEAMKERVDELIESRQLASIDVKV
ncbi:hypothetical protein [Lysinibacillus fusiformis]|uniref:hypothetical protein n=1 Tax=Lysinibacillus fusiformis TaxID=28031 RepID=UPI003D088E58